MPNIPVYTSQVRPARRSGAQARAAANIGEVQRDMFRTIGSQIESTTQFIDQQQGQRETSKLTKEGAEYTANLAKSWDEFAKAGDPNDPQLAEKWTAEVLDPALEKFGEGAWSTAGQELRENYTSRLRAHFFTKTTADEMAIAGAMVQTNLEAAANIGAAAARVDPSSMQMQIDMFNDGLEHQIATHPNLSATEIAQMRAQLGGKAAAEIALAAGLGMAERNPAAAKAELAKGDKSVFGKYLDVRGRESITEAITEAERAAEVEQNRAEAAERERKEAFAEEAENEYTSQIILDPSKLDPRAVARDPRLTSTQKRVITNFQDEEIRKRKAGIEEGAGKGPGFWNAYSKVFANGFKNTDEIYALVGPGKPLELSDANALATLWRGRRENTRASDFQDERVKSFFDGMHTKMTRTQFGGTIPGGEEAWRKFYFDKTRAIDNRGEKSLDQLIDEDSPDYVGKDYQGYMPQRAQSTYQPEEEPTERTWMDFFGGLISQAKPDTKSLDTKFKDGEEGSAAGLSALRAAIASGMSQDEAAAYALKRGWIRASEPKATAPSVPPALR